MEKSAGEQQHRDQARAAPRASPAGQGSIEGPTPATSSNRAWCDGVGLETPALHHAVAAYLGSVISTREWRPVRCARASSSPRDARAEAPFFVRRRSPGDAALNLEFRRVTAPFAPPPA